MQAEKWEEVYLAQSQDAVRRRRFFLFVPPEAMQV